jgi:hypothetical protein
LLAIRDGRLCRDEYATFEDYCRERWGSNRAHAYRLIEAAATVAELSPIGDTPPPTNEAQARELARIPQGQRAEVWQRVTEQHGNRVTAQHIREAARPDVDPPLLSIIDLDTGEIATERTRKAVPRLGLKSGNGNQDWDALERATGRAQGSRVTVSASEQQDGARAGLGGG